MTTNGSGVVPTREALVHLLYEAAELEHNLMCTYLYAAFSLKRGEAEGLSAEQAAAVDGFRRTLVRVAVEEMGHLSAVWNITAALGSAPRFGRGNFPLDPGALPARLVVKLAPFDAEVLQHFIHLERPEGSDEREGKGFEPSLLFSRNSQHMRLVPMAIDYETVGAFYARLDAGLRAFVAHHGEKIAFAGDPALQLSAAEVDLAGAKPVLCSKTAHAAFSAIVTQGEGAPEHAENSHFQRFIAMREALAALERSDPEFHPAFPAAVNPVLRPPLRPEGRVWIEDEEAARTVDIANTAYALMLRLLAHTYLVPRPDPLKGLAVDLSLALMHVVTDLGERAARLPAGPSHPSCHAGMSFTALRDAGALPRGASSWRFFSERLTEMAVAAKALDLRDERAARAAQSLEKLVERAARALELALSATRAGPDALARASAAGEQTVAPPVPVTQDGVDAIDGKHLTLLYEGKKCIHARFCVTGAPSVFLANVKGPWIHPDAMDAEALVAIAEACPSGAIRYRRKDGRPEEAAPPVNLIATREAGPYAVRGALELDGRVAGFRATLCRCGASKNKPFCDGSHHDVHFDASGEPPTTGKTDMLELRSGPLRIDAQVDGPLAVRGNLEITSGTGRVVARLQTTRLCRCGASNTKPFCDGSHARVGFKSS